MIPLDVLVAQAVSGAHALERALHDPGPWTVRLGSVEVPAQRVIYPQSVAFVVPLGAERLPAGLVAELLCRGEVVSCRALTDDRPDGELFADDELVWELSPLTPTEHAEAA